MVHEHHRIVNELAREQRCVAVHDRVHFLTRQRGMVLVDVIGSGVSLSILRDVHATIGEHGQDNGSVVDSSHVIKLFGGGVGLGFVDASDADRVHVDAFAEVLSDAALDVSLHVVEMRLVDRVITVELDGETDSDVVHRMLGVIGFCNVANSDLLSTVGEQSGVGYLCFAVMRAVMRLAASIASSVSGKGWSGRMYLSM